jgi:hypothetical protein
MQPRVHPPTAAVKGVVHQEENANVKHKMNGASITVDRTHFAVQTCAV